MKKQTIIRKLLDIGTSEKCEKCGDRLITTTEALCYWCFLVFRAKCDDATIASMYLAPDLRS